MATLIKNIITRIKSMFGLISIILMFVALSLFGWIGFWGIVSIETIITFAYLYTKKDILIAQYKLFETTLYGKPLDKGLWTKKEWKNKTKFDLFKEIKNIKRGLKNGNKHKGSNRKGVKATK